MASLVVAHDSYVECFIGHVYMAALHWPKLTKLCYYELWDTDVCCIYTRTAKTFLSRFSGTLLLQIASYCLSVVCL